MRPAPAQARTRAVARGATTCTEAPARKRLRIFASPTRPAPTTSAGRSSSFRNNGKSAIFLRNLSSPAGRALLLSVEKQKARDNRVRRGPFTELSWNLP